MRGMYFMLILAYSLHAYSHGQSGVRLWDAKRYSINAMDIEITNYGTFRDLEWPKGSRENYLYGAGIWFGVIKENDTLVTIGYGPHGAETEFAPGLQGHDPNDPQVIIYMHPTPWPAPLDIFPMAPQDTLSDQDSWCCYNDCDTVYHVPNDTWPIGIEVYQTGYAWNLPALHNVLFLFFEIKNVSNAQLEDCYVGLCIDADVGNEAGNSNDIYGVIIGKWYVIGGESLYVDDLGYQWQEVPESGWSRFPGVVGFDLIQTPYKLIENEDDDNDGILDQYETDSAYFMQYVPEDLHDADKDGLPDWRDPSEIPQWGLTAFKRFTLNLEPNRDNERYLTLAGYNFKTGQYQPYDTIPPDPDDQRFLMASGPFALAQDSSTTLGLAIMCADWDGIFLRPDSALVRQDYIAQYVFDRNWLVPGPPPPPNLTVIPGDKQITLVWDNLSETTPDPHYDLVGTNPTSPLFDPYYQQYDFEGYGIWRSMTGETTDWELLERYDKANGIVFVDPAMNLEATDNGIVHSFVDTDVRNGFTYYYAISAFDYNWVKDFYEPDGKRAIWFESGRVWHAGVPRREPADYIPPGKAELMVTAGNPRLNSLFSAMVVSPFDLATDKPVYCEFGAPDTASHDTFVQVIDTTVTPYDTFALELSVDGCEHVVYLKNELHHKIDSLRIKTVPGGGYRSHEFMQVNGIAVTARCGRDEYPTMVKLFDHIQVAGSYPAQSVIGLECRLPAIGVLFQGGNWYPDTLYDHGFWAWRGNDYKVEWIKTHGSNRVNSVVVTDASTGDTIPYKAFQNNPETRHLGEGWCFTRHTSFGYPPWTTPSHDTLQVYGSAATKTRSLYICAGLIALNGGAPIIDTIIPAEHDVWFVRANPNYLPPSVYGEAIATATPPTWLDKVTHLNVKVVPNPYVIHNEWQRTIFPKRLRFINLPSKCTIRIFSLCGELVKVITHSATVTYEDEQEVINNHGGDEWWNLLNMYRQQVSSGIYIFHVDSDVGEQVGKFVVIQ